MAGCDRSSYDHLPASSISKDGFARDGEAMRAANGTEIRVWGFVDYANVDYGVVPAPADARLPGAAAALTWSFNLKAKENDAPGHSFRVVVPEDEAAGNLKQKLVEAGRSGRPVRAYVTGSIRTFEAPANLRRYTGFYLVVPRSQAVSLGRPSDAASATQQARSRVEEVAQPR
jgi:hypothetical protein